MRSSPRAGDLPAFSAVILDMDGLVLDSETTYCGAWRKAAADVGHALDDGFLESLFGRHADDVVQALAAELRGPAEQRQGPELQGPADQQQQLAAELWGPPAAPRREAADDRRSR